jgi:hypothetical protein
MTITASFPSGSNIEDIPDRRGIRDEGVLSCWIVVDGGGFQAGNCRNCIVHNTPCSCFVAVITMVVVLVVVVLALLLLVVVLVVVVWLISGRFRHVMGRLFRFSLVLQQLPHYGLDFAYDFTTLLGIAENCSKLLSTED